MALPSLGLSEQLASLVQSKYASAKASGALTFSSTQLTVSRVHGIPFQLRWCPALAHKPTGKESGTDQKEHSQSQRGSTRFNPFECPSADLLVARVPFDQPKHNIVLNKYPVIPEHFILATKEYKNQTDKLEDDDLAMTYACLRAWEPGLLFAFFNSGEHSGASQGHRHVQFLPKDQIQREGVSEWTPLIDLMDGCDSLDGHGFQVQASSNGHVTRSLPFAHFSLPIASTTSSSKLLDTYNTLYGHAVDAVRTSCAEAVRSPDGLEVQSNTTTISYNLAMTTSRMVICPRRSEASTISNAGSIAVNGTLLLGTLMVKSEELWDALRGKEGEVRLKKVLADVGVPWSNSPKTNEKK